MATEAGYDGGNVKISINGATFAVIPAAAYIFNAPSKLDRRLRPTPTRSRARTGFTGTDGGEIGGIWGTSQVDLTAAGVKAGDKVSCASTSVGTAAAASTAGTSTTSRSTCVLAAPAPAGREGRRS